MTRQNAFAFLFSYKPLIRYKSDLRIAKDLRLISKKVEIEAWGDFMDDLSDFAIKQLEESIARRHKYHGGT